MKANRLLSLITAAVLVSASVTFPQAQGAALQASGSPQVVRACADVERSIPENSSKGASACAVALETSLNADDAALALLMSAKGPNAVNVKRLLVKQGLTMQQLEGAQIRFAKIEMDSPSRIKITIKCCPLTIIISF